MAEGTTVPDDLMQATTVLYIVLTVLYAVLYVRGEVLPGMLYPLCARARLL